MRSKALACCLGTVWLVLGCGDDSGGGGADAPPAGGDATAGADAAAGSDGGSGAGGPGSLCATSAVPPAPGSCGDGLLCCGIGGNSVCVYDDECGSGTNWVACTPGGGECASVGGRVCCMVEDIMTFCTKPSSCADYGGTVVD